VQASSPKARTDERAGNGDGAAAFDTGPIIAQAVVPVIDAIASGDVPLAGGVRIAPRCTDESAMLTSLPT
jgi:hypothetical protein